MGAIIRPAPWPSWGGSKWSAPQTAGRPGGPAQSPRRWTMAIIDQRSGVHLAAGHCFAQHIVHAGLPALAAGLEHRQHVRIHA